MDERYLEKVIEEGENLNELIKSEGWKILEDWLARQISGLFDSLLTCSIDEVQTRRAKIEALRSIARKAGESIELGKRAEKELKEAKNGKNQL